MKCRVRDDGNSRSLKHDGLDSIPGIVLWSGEDAVLVCPTDKHKLAEILGGQILEIRDRRCKRTVRFDLSELGLREDKEAKAE